jgi:AcrR family transcriptional regulator
VSRHAKRATSTRKSEETRKRIFEAALELFVERGFEETTMRDVAKRAGLATGAAYYYFDSKEELVLEFYRQSQSAMVARFRGSSAGRVDLRTRLGELIFAKFDQFGPYRPLLGALFRRAADPASAMSPFADATRDIRDDAIALFAEAIEAADVRPPKDIAPHLPRLLWLYQLGLILFWIYDRSEGQVRTRRLAEKSLDLVVRLIRLAKFPLLRPVRRTVVELLEGQFDDTAQASGEAGSS